MRSAANTCALISSNSGLSVAAQAPTWSAMVDTDSSIPSRPYCSLCRLSGWWLAYFATSIIANRLAPAKPRAITWKGAGGWVIFSQLRQENFSRTCLVTNHCLGMTSNDDVTSSPILESLLEPQHGHDCGAG